MTGDKMIGLVLVSHGNLAGEMLAALEHVCGPQPHAIAVSIGANDEMEQRRQEILDAVRMVDTGNGVAILTDMFGGTPSNLAISVLGGGTVEVLAGMNLPMLVKLAGRRHLTLEDAVAAAAEAGKKYIRVVSRLLADHKR